MLRLVTVLFAIVVVNILVGFAVRIYFPITGVDVNPYNGDVWVSTNGGAYRYNQQFGGEVLLSNSKVISFLKLALAMMDMYGSYQGVLVKAMLSYKKSRHLV